MRYYIIAGEASGDLHGSNLMKGLYAADPSATIRFRGGEMMEKVYRQHSPSDNRGGGLAYDYREGAVMGFFEVLFKARMLMNQMEDCKEDVFEFMPDVLILIDYPGFNLKMARWAHKLGFKVFYYIAPKVWATREYRVKQLKKYVDHLFIVFPFEVPFFEKRGLEYTYCGNPLVDAVDGSPAATQSREEFLQEIGIHPSTPVVAMLAGSRMGEIRQMLPLFVECARIMHEKPRFRNHVFVIAGAPGRSMEDYGSISEDYIRIVFGRTQQIVRAAEAAAINSGTASLEAALLGTPQVVVYKVPSRLTYFLVRLIIKVKYISLGNLCLDKLAFRELYSYADCTPQNLAQELERLIVDEKYRRAMLEDYNAIRKSLGGRGASFAVARAMIDRINKQ